jgi:hypothetical protein
MLSLLSHIGEGAVEETLVVAWCRYQVMLVMALLDLAGDGATEATLVIV